MTDQEAVEVLKMVSAAYPNVELKLSTIDVYVQALSNIPADVAKKAALEHIHQSRFFPTVAELLERAREQPKLALMDADDIADEEYRERVVRATSGDDHIKQFIERGLRYSRTHERPKHGL